MGSRFWVRAGAALLILGFAGIVWVDLANDTLRADAVTNTIAWFLVAAVGYAALSGIQTATGLAMNWKWLLVVGLALRLLMLVTTPTLSDDVYRYLWEGHLVTEGVSPYSFAIDSPLGDAYDIPARSLANNTSLASPYLPAAHGLFGAVALVLPSEPWTMQLMMIAFDVLAVSMLSKLLRLADLPDRRVLLYWLNPLVIVEVAHGAHIDAVILALVAAGLVFTLDRPRTSPVIVYAGPLLIAAATLTRPLALLLIPVLFWLWNWRQRMVWAVALLVPVTVAAAFVGSGLRQPATGTGVFGSARAYTDSFRFNSGIYHWLERWIASQGLDDQGWNEPAALTRLVVIGIVGALMVPLFVAAKRALDIRGALRLLAVPVMIYVLFTPVFHPWYLLLLLGLVPFVAPGADEAAVGWLRVMPWLTLGILAVFSYLTYEDPQAFAEREWVRRLEWYPTLALVAVATASQPLMSLRHASGQ